MQAKARGVKDALARPLFQFISLAFDWLAWYVSLLCRLLLLLLSRCRAVAARSFHLRATSNEWQSMFQRDSFTVCWPDNQISHSDTYTDGYRQTNPTPNPNPLYRSVCVIWWLNLCTHGLFCPSTDMSTTRGVFSLLTRSKWALVVLAPTSGRSSSREMTLCPTLSPWESPSAMVTPCPVLWPAKRWRRPSCRLEWNTSIQ